MRSGVLITSNLSQLQNLIKRDPTAYREEFLQQWLHYNSIRQIFVIDPNDQAQHFKELVGFIAQVSTCYPKETAEFPSQISFMLLDNYNTLSPDIRKSLLQNLVMMRNKNVTTSIEILKTLFPLLPRTTSSSLRTFIKKTIINDIKNANLRTKNHKLNRAIQAMLFTMVEQGIDNEVVGDKGKHKAQNQSGAHAPSGNGGEAMWAIILTKELWRKGIWMDVKPVSIIALGCFHSAIKVQSAAIHFFLGADEEKEDSDEEEEEDIDIKALKHRREVNKKSKSADNKLRKKIKTAKKNQKKAPGLPNFPALQLLNDPQNFAERLYEILNRYDKRFSLDHKLLLIQLLSRLTAYHKLHILPFYPYIIKYLTHHQLQVPTILAALAQSVHELTPPEDLIPVLRKIATEFVHPGVGSEVICAGLNAIREVCKRQPWAMEEDLLGDLVEYRKSRDKGVNAAARGLLQLYREVNPGMLKRRERGKDASMGMAKGSQPLPFGHTATAASDIEGLSLLEDHLKDARQDSDDEHEEDDDEKAWEGWDVESEDSSDSASDGWISVSDDEGNGNLAISDSEDEKEADGDVKMADDETEMRQSTLATTKILTPADFALLNDLRIQAATKAAEASGTSRSKRKLAQLTASLSKSKNQDDDSAGTFISEADITGPAKRQKADYAERMASIEKGREGREKFGSLKGKKRKETMSSSTNKEKKKNKPIMMILSSAAVRGKKKASLREKQTRLRKHIEKAKKSYH